jgi:hypothetical protein
MSMSDDLSQFRHVSPEVKISVLRMEMIPLLAAIRTYADSIKYGVNFPEKPPEIDLWVNKIIDATNRLEQLRDILYDNPE